MNKNLAKIITICVLAVIIPVAIIVTAVCLSSAVTYSLTLAIEGTVENVGEYTLKVNGKEYKDALKFSKGQNITVEVETTGYNFAGWYEGETFSREGDKAVSNNEKFTFQLLGNVNLTAVVDLIQYQVSYAGGETKTVNYGTALPTTATVEENYVFGGWYYGDNEANIVSEAADLEDVTPNESGVIELKVKKLVTYKVSYDGVEAEDRILEGTELAGADKAVLGNGKKFVAWRLNNQEGAKVSVADKAIFGSVANTTAINLVSEKTDVKYTVVYNYETPVTVNDVAYENDLAVVDSTQLANGYVAVDGENAGWVLGETVYTKAIFEGFEHEDATITLEPSQRKVVYTIKYNAEATGTETEFGAELAGAEKATGIVAANGEYFAGWKIAGYETVYTNANFGENEHEDKAITLTTNKGNYYKDNRTYKSVTINPSFGTIYESVEDNVPIDSATVTKKYTVKYDEEGNATTESGSAIADLSVITIRQLLNEKGLETVYDEENNQVTVSVVKVKNGLDEYVVDLDGSIEQLIKNFDKNINGATDAEPSATFAYGNEITLEIHVIYA